MINCIQNKILIIIILLHTSNILFSMNSLVRKTIQTMRPIITKHQRGIVHNAYSAFEILGIKPGQSQQDIKSAYIKKAKEYHPDLSINNPHATQQFQDLTNVRDYLLTLKPQEQIELYNMHKPKQIQKTIHYTQQIYTHPSKKPKTVSQEQSQTAYQKQYKTTYQEQYQDAYERALKKIQQEKYEKEYYRDQSSFLTKIKSFFQSIL